MEPKIVERVQQLSGQDAESAARITIAVLGVLCEELPAPERARFLRALPARLAHALMQPAPAQSDTLEAFYQRIAQRTALPLGPAVEHTQLVCGSLTEQLDETTLTLLKTRLPSSFLVLFERRELQPLPEHSAHDQRRYATLADGHAGSSHPVSQAHPERAHRDSVVRSDNPHADTKLASSRGVTQVRESESLAQAHPEPKRPLSTGKE